MPIWYLYGLAMANSGLYNEAADAFAQSLQLRAVPAEPQIFGYYGNALVNAGRANEAVQFATEQVRYYEFQMNQFQQELRGRTQVDQPTMSRYMNYLFVLSELHQTLAVAYNQLGDTASAQQHAQQRQQYLDALNQYR
jgi:tetratricopeptide (TPR) repeat protein